MKYRKKPVIVEADHFDGSEESARVLQCKYPMHIFREVGGDHVTWTGRLQVATLEGYTIASPQDWIIRGVAGEIYPCKPHIFHKTYEPVEGR
jgi:hypothetical protein